MAPTPMVFQDKRVINEELTFGFPQPAFVPDIHSLPFTPVKCDFLFSLIILK